MAGADGVKFLKVFSYFKNEIDNINFIVKFLQSHPPITETFRSWLKIDL